jgi:hypothetical protein
MTSKLGFVRIAAPSRGENTKVGMQGVTDIIIIIIIWLYSPSWALASPIWDFVTIAFLRGWIVSPEPNPQPRGPGLRIYDPWRQGGPAKYPGTGYPF